MTKRAPFTKPELMTVSVQLIANPDSDRSERIWRDLRTWAIGHGCGEMQYVARQALQYIRRNNKARLTADQIIRLSSLSGASRTNKAAKSMVMTALRMCRVSDDPGLWRDLWDLRLPPSLAMDTTHWLISLAHDIYKETTANEHP